MDIEFISESEGERLFQEHVDQCEQHGVQFAFDTPEIRAMVKQSFLKRHGFRTVPDKLLEVRADA